MDAEVAGETPSRGGQACAPRGAWFEARGSRMMRRVVVDTHVLMASLLGGEARLVMRYWWEGKVALVLSEEIVEEYLAALARLGDTKEGARELVEAFGKPAPGPAGGQGGERVVWVGAGREEGGRRQAPALRAAESPEGGGALETSREEGGPKVRPTGRLEARPTNPFPKRPVLNKFVEAAVAGKAEAIIAGDPDLVERGGYKGILILTPGGFLEGGGKA